MTADPQIIEQARSADPDARQKAAFLVAQSTTGANLPLMFELLGDKDWRVRKTIVDGFVRDARAEIVEGLLDALADAENAGKRNSSTEALVRIGESAIAPIVARLRREQDIDVRLSLVNLIGDLRSREGFQMLLDLLRRETDVNVASSIVSSLGKYRDAGALPHLMRVLREREDLWLKFHIIEALGEIGDRAALPAILPLYAEKSLRKPVLEAVGKIADVGTVNFLLADHHHGREAEPHGAARAGADRGGVEAADRGGGGAAASFSRASGSRSRATRSSRSRSICRPRPSARSRCSSSSSWAGPGTCARCRC